MAKRECVHECVCECVGAGASSGLRQITVIKASCFSRGGPGPQGTASPGPGPLVKVTKALESPYPLFLVTQK